ncbi:GNAT family N-acetyltransferase [Planobispora longispora]|uniref:Putative acetyltransferase n=1 Tax=Planobispora longispora TaxID=28887 RepID=A0A8J3W5U6_9ACTN|nr:GNAT family N-acetyltransferase [Planobispora longispora]GIH77839.1 putative acetyltransferase [Planobispora longispora]
MIRPAVPEDISAIVDMVRGLAEYEKALDQVETSPEQLHEALFGENPAVFCHIAEDDGRVAGFAVWFLSFSTWQGRHGIYLEDLYVHPDHRGGGHGKALLTELARICVERGYGRFEWSVLDWNTSAQAFYAAMGAVPTAEWDRWRLDGDALVKAGS